ncbi:hypothetical protein BDZ89DRAFT_1033586 [Hymenopellis radicata]|nr:hypothetical protein BDZ89DRAFT_1033586 [Hymenopellis radicata]
MAAAATATMTSTSRPFASTLLALSVRFLLPRDPTTSKIKRRLTRRISPDDWQQSGRRRTRSTSRQRQLQRRMRAIFPDSSAFLWWRGSASSVDDVGYGSHEYRRGLRRLSTSMFLYHGQGGASTSLFAGEADITPSVSMTSISTTNENTPLINPAVLASSKTRTQVVGEVVTTGDDMPLEEPSAPEPVLEAPVEYRSAPAPIDGVPGPASVPAPIVDNPA